MKTNKEGIKLIKSFESLHDGDLTILGLQPKMDPIGIWTEGYGRAMRDSKGNFIKGIANKKLAYSRITIKTEKEAAEALFNDLGAFENTVMRKIKVELKQNQFDALVSHTYNTGGSNTLFELINNNSNDMIIKNWFVSKYISADGVVLKGLIERRKAEANLYFK
jgi:lysozyme